MSGFRGTPRTRSQLLGGPRAAPEGDDEAGFTLIEIIIVVAILPIIIGAIAMALISVFSLQGSVNNTGWGLQ